jgi:hypothetical protein
MDQANISVKSSLIQDDIQEIACLTPYSTEEIHARAREKTRAPTKNTIMKKKSVSMPQDTTSLTVTVPLSINEIHSQAQAKLTNNNVKAECRYGKTPKRLSLNYKKNKAVFPATNKTTNNINSTPKRIDSDRESSPEVILFCHYTFPLYYYMLSNRHCGLFSIVVQHLSHACRKTMIYVIIYCSFNYYNTLVIITLMCLINNLKK